MKFYNLEKEIIKKEFVKQYNESYFLNGKKQVNAIQSSRWIEKEIELILENGIKTREDVIRILAWKRGKIKHQASEDNKKFVYHSDWDDAEKHPERIKNYGKEFNIVGFVDYIVENIECLKNKEPQEILNLLNKKAPAGIGTVYMITLLYFIKKCKYPIYDKYAMIALDAIIGEKEPGSDIEYKELPSRKSKAFGNVIELYNEKYIKKLKKCLEKNIMIVEILIELYGCMVIFLILIKKQVVNALNASDYNFLHRIDI